MNKKQILSTLMAAVISLTSVPFAAMAVSAESITVASVDTADFTPSLINDTKNRGVAVVQGTLNTGNKYLSNYHKLGGMEGIKVTFTTEVSATDQTYTLTFSARSPLSNKMTARVFVNIGSNRELHNLPGTDKEFWTPDVTNVWYDDYSVEFTVPKQTAQYSVLIFTRNDTNSITPIDLDNIVIRKGAASTEAIVYAENFENCEVKNLGSSGWSVYEADGRGKIEPYINYGSTYSIAVDESFTRVAESSYNGHGYTWQWDGYKNYQGNIALTYDEDMTLEAGEYVLKGTFRNSQFFVSSNHYDYYYPVEGNTQIIRITNDLNKFAAKAVINCGTASFESPVLDVHNGWTDFEYRFTLEDAADISSIQFAFDHQAKPVDNPAAGWNALANRPILDYKNITLERLDEGEISDSATADLGAPTVDAGTVVSEGAGNVGNKYLEIYDRSSIGHGVLLTVPALSDSVRNYRVEAKVRSTVDNMSEPQTRYFFMYSGQLGINVGYSMPYGDFWNTYTKDFSVPAGTKEYKIELRTRQDDRWYPFEIDDITVYDTDTNRVVYCEDFEGYDVSIARGAMFELSDFETGVKLTPTDSAINSNTAYGISVEEEFVNITDSTVDGEMSMTFLNRSITLEPGVYILKGDFRNASYHQRYGFINTTTTPWINQNTFELNCELVGDNFTKTSKASVVSCGWYSFLYRFDVDKPTTLSEISFNMTHTGIKWMLDNGAEAAIGKFPLTVDFKNITLEYRPDDKDGSIPNVGIVMMLLAKKKAQTDGSSEIVKPEPVDYNIIKNGDLSAEPIIVSQISDADGSAWIRNDGTSADGVHHEHNITWNDGYVTVSGRAANTRNFFYKSDAVLEPGTYRLSVDFKTAVSGETTAMRVGVSGDAVALFDPGVVSVASVGNGWMTHTIEFTVDTPTSFRLNFLGGPSAKFIQDICIDNLVLKKVQ